MSNNDLLKIAVENPSKLTKDQRQLLIKSGYDDFVRGGKTQSPVGEAAMLGLTYAAVKNPLKALRVIGTDGSTEEISAELLSNKRNLLTSGKQLVKGTQRIGELLDGVFSGKIPRTGTVGAMRNPNLEPFDWGYYRKFVKPPSVLNDIKDPILKRQAEQSLYNKFKLAEKYIISKGKPPIKPLRGFGQTWTHPVSGAEYSIKQRPWGFTTSKIDPNRTVQNLRRLRDKSWSSDIQKQWKGFKLEDKEAFNEKIARHFQRLEKLKKRLLKQQRTGEDVSDKLNQVNARIIQHQDEAASWFGEHGYALGSPIWEYIKKNPNQFKQIARDARYPGDTPYPMFKPGDAKNFHLVKDVLYKKGGTEFSITKTRIETFIHKHYPELAVNYNPDLDTAGKIIRLEKMKTIRVNKNGIMSGDVAGYYDFNQFGNLPYARLQEKIVDIIGYNPIGRNIRPELPSYPHLVKPPIQVTPVSGFTKSVKRNLTLEEMMNKVFDSKPE